MLDVIASEAKQSRGSKQELDCFVARAPRNDGEMFVMTSRKLPRFPDAVRHLPDANASPTCRSARSGHPFTSPLGRGRPRSGRVRGYAPSFVRNPSPGAARRPLPKGEVKQSPALQRTANAKRAP